MITGEQRRDAALFLRGCDCTAEECEECRRISGSLLDSENAFCDMNVSFARLADLIDSPSCLDLVEHEQDPFIPGKRMVDGYFHCSDCGWDGQIWEHIGFGDMLAYEAVHCPKCGAIIERRA